MHKFMNGRGFALLDALDDAPRSTCNPEHCPGMAYDAPSITAPIASVTSGSPLHELSRAVTIKLDSSSLNKLNI